MDLHRLHPKTGQQFQQTPLCQILANLPLRLQRDPLPRQRKLAQGQHVIAEHLGLEPHPVFATLFILQQQTVAQHVAAEPVVGGQIGGGARRSLARQIGGGGAEQHPGLPQFAGHQSRVGQATDPQCHVDPLGNQIPLLVVGDDLDGEAGVGLQQRGQCQCEWLARHPHRGGDPNFTEQGVAHLRETQLGLAQGLLQRPAPLPYHLSRLGQTEATGRAMEQGQPEQALQLADMLTDGGGGHAKGFGCPCHAARFHHGGEDGVTSELFHY